MLKYVSLIIMLGALIGSWAITNAEPEVSISVHASLQQEVEDIIRNYIQQHRPAAANIQFYQLFTETLSPTKVRAIFKYSFDDSGAEAESTHQMFEGSAILNKEPQKEGEKSVWSLDEVNAQNTSIEYKKGAEVHPGGSEEPPAPPSDPSETD